MNGKITFSKRTERPKTKRVIRRLTKINSWRTAWRSLLTKFFADENFLLYSRARDDCGWRRKFWWEREVLGVQIIEVSLPCVCHRQYGKLFQGIWLWKLEHASQKMFSQLNIQSDPDLALPNQVWSKGGYVVPVVLLNLYVFADCKIDHVEFVHFFQWPSMVVKVQFHSISIHQVNQFYSIYLWLNISHFKLSSIHTKAKDFIFPAWTCKSLNKGLSFFLAIWFCPWFVSFGDEVSPFNVCFLQKTPEP